ncbi:alpha-L-fucosidase [Pinibacter aurantiacus]|uniref:Alpha-L-fucosidase n=1 Tax=Pinibacter aurantiacus TaxID=2851599 RepID=A0A9E2SCR2_9BACT|nr:alpha-L-fucosidase [Pinibacter aurantiacus]MBV4358927.1 alpha-L-fucosidase [Pinibacter aurantiacus]
MRNNTKRISLLCGLLLCLIGLSHAQGPNVPALPAVNKQSMKDFMDLRFGMFIHWGPVTLRGTEIGWSRNRQVAQNDYDSLYKEFDPVLFDADAWVKTAKDAGMKYIVITAKHHDGFCLWPTAYTKYNIMQTPFKKDVVGALAKACKKYNIKFGIYYTVLDWYERSYPVHNDGKGMAPDGDMNKFVQYMKSQLKELIDNYHPFLLWFDGNWEQPWTNEYGKDIYAYLKKLDPTLVVNNRLGKGDHVTLSDQSVGDYATPEQKIGKLNMSFPWESCITICNQWAWKPNDAMKPLKQCISTLALTAGGNGNLLFNVGPMPDGRMEARQVKQLKAMGDWLKQNGASIYGTLGGPFTPDSSFASTRKGNKIYIHLLNASNKHLTLAAIPGVHIQKAYSITGTPISVTENATSIELQIPDTLVADANDTVIVLEADKSVEDIPVMARN